MDPLADGTFPSMVHVVAAALLVVGVGVPLLVSLGRRQRNAVMSYAVAQGWTYHDRDPGLAQRYLGPPFVPDLGADAEAVIAGRYHGLPFAAYAYTYQTSTVSPAGTSTMTHAVPVVALLVESSIPDIDVSPLEPLDVASPTSEFDRAFRVSTHDERLADLLLTPSFRDELMAAPRYGWSWRSGDLLSLGSWSGKPEKIPVHLEHLGMIVRAMPAELWSAYGAQRPML